MTLAAAPVAGNTGTQVAPSRNYDITARGVHSCDHILDLVSSHCQHSCSRCQVPHRQGLNVWCLLKSDRDGIRDLSNGSFA